MKVKCIDNRAGFITIGKIYDVIDDDDECQYLIIDDNGDEDWWYSKKYFKPLSEIRNEKIERLLGE